MDRKFIITAFVYAILGMALGAHMGASHNHSQFVTHAHILLAGFLLSFAYGLCHRLWLGNQTSRLATVQFIMHHTGVVLMSGGLFMLYGQYASEKAVEPLLATSSPLVLLGMILMLVLFVRSGNNTPATA